MSMQGDDMKKGAGSGSRTQAQPATTLIRVCRCCWREDRTGVAPVEQDQPRRGRVNPLVIVNDLCIDCYKTVRSSGDGPRVYDQRLDSDGIGDLRITDYVPPYPQQTAGPQLPHERRLAATSEQRSQGLAQVHSFWRNVWLSTSAEFPEHATRWAQRDWAMLHPGPHAVVNLTLTAWEQRIFRAWQKVCEALKSKRKAPEQEDAQG